MSQNNTPKPKPRASKAVPAVEPVEVYDAILEPLEEIVEPEVVVPVEEYSPPTTYAVVSNGASDSVYASKCIYKNILNKKSLSVHHLQRRLAEWGHRDAFLDKDGYYGDLTKKSVEEFQAAHGLEVTGIADYVTLTRIFAGDSNVTVVPE